MSFAKRERRECEWCSTKWIVFGSFSELTENDVRLKHLLEETEILYYQEENRLEIYSQPPTDDAKDQFLGGYLAVLMGLLVGSPAALSWMAFQINPHLMLSPLRWKWRSARNKRCN